ncbi:cyclin-A1-like [Diretmus argenteus]
MNLNTNPRLDSHTSKENVPPSNQLDLSRAPRAKQRKVLGVLTEKEHPGQSFSQGGQISKHSSISDSSLSTFIGYTSSSSFDVYVDEPCKVLAASGEVVASEPDEDAAAAAAAALQHKGSRLFVELSTTDSCPDISMQSSPDEDEPLMFENPLCLSEYAEEIHQHLREREMRFSRKPGYMRMHPEITNCMRIILVDWLVEIGQEYKLCCETLHLAVSYLDRFLSRTSSVKRGKLQLVGTAAMLLAAKYEEISPPGLDQFVYLTDGTYTKQQLVWMEHVFLKVLAFNMAVPTAYQFLCQFMAIQSVCSKTESLSMYVAELSLLEVDMFLQYTPSMVAAAAYCLANYTLNNALWPDSLHAFTGYNMAKIWPCLNDLHALYVSAESRPQQAIREKYKRSE